MKPCCGLGGHDHLYWCVQIPFDHVFLPRFTVFVYGHLFELVPVCRPAEFHECARGSVYGVPLMYDVWCRVFYSVV